MDFYKDEFEDDILDNQWVNKLAIHQLQENDEDEKQDFDVQFLSHLILEIQSNFNSEKIEILQENLFTLCNYIKNILKPFHYEENSTDLCSLMNNLLNYNVNENLINPMHFLFSLIEENTVHAKILNNKTMSECLTCFIALFSFKNDFEYYYCEEFNYDFIMLIFQIINKNIDSNLCFLLLYHILKHRADLFNDIEQNFILDQIKNHIEENSFLFAYQYLYQFRLYIPDILHLFLENYELYPIECMKCLTLCSKYSKNTIKSIITHETIFDLEKFEDDDELLTSSFIFISNLIKYAESDDKIFIINHLQIHKLNILTLNTILKYSSKFSNEIISYCLQLPIFDIATDASFKEKQQFIENIALLIQNGAFAIVEPFIHFSLEFIESISSDVDNCKVVETIHIIIKTLTFIVITVNEEEKIISILTILDNSNDILSELSDSDNADIENDTKSLFKAIEDRKTELELS